VTQPSIQEILKSGVTRIDTALEHLLPAAATAPVSIHSAMRHSVFAGGKRVRPILCMEAARAIAGEIPAGVEDLGAAIEMLHTYSLIHDDLPALDDDDLRRGKPTCHVVYGEAIAILAGDALQTQAYITLGDLKCPPASAIRIVREIAIATGTGVGGTLPSGHGVALSPGMIGGQVMDIEGENQKPTAAMVEAIHRAKTGALIAVSIVVGGLYAGADDKQLAALRIFGEKAGLAFQIVDDVLDMTQTSEQLGKTAGKDTASEKATWPAVYGIEKSERDAAQFIAEAFDAIAPLGAAADPLKSLAQYLVERKN